METPLTPLDFLRRARKLHGGREAVVDGDLRLTYAQFGERCDRWSAALAKLGVQPGDRVATSRRTRTSTSSSTTRCRRLGAVIVPLNYRLIAGRLRLPRQPQRREGGVRARRLPRRGR